MSNYFEAYLFSSSGDVSRPGSRLLLTMLGIWKDGPPVTLDDFRFVALSAVMGKWNVRCRTLAIVQSLKIYKAAPMYNTFMAWVRANPELCREPAK